MLPRMGELAKWSRWEEEEIAWGRKRRIKVDVVCEELYHKDDE